MRPIFDCHVDEDCYSPATFDTNRRMSGPSNQSPNNSDLLKNSTLYREFQAEREEILRHKWIESEKAGHDIGFEQALTDWMFKHRARWRKTRQSTSTDTANN